MSDNKNLQGCTSCKQPHSLAQPTGQSIEFRSIRPNGIAQEHPKCFAVDAPPEPSSSDAERERRGAGQGKSALHCLRIQLYAARGAHGRRGDESVDGYGDRVQP